MRNTSKLSDSRGNAFIEYLVVAFVVLGATVAFYETNLKNAGAGARGQVEAAFSDLCQRVGGAPCY